MNRLWKAGCKCIVLKRICLGEPSYCPGRKKWGSLPRSRVAWQRGHAWEGGMAGAPCSACPPVQSIFPEARCGAGWQRQIKERNGRGMLHVYASDGAGCCCHFLHWYLFQSCSQCTNNLGAAAVPSCVPREGKGGSGEPGAARVSCPAEGVCLGVTVNDTRTKRVFYTLQLASLWSSLLQTSCGFLSLISSRVSISLLKYH